MIALKTTKVIEDDSHYIKNITLRHADFEGNLMYNVPYAVEARRITIILTENYELVRQMLPALASQLRGSVYVKIFPEREIIYPRAQKDAALEWVEKTDSQYFILSCSPFIIDALLENADNEDLRVWYVYARASYAKITDIEITIDSVSEMLFVGDSLFWNLDRYEDNL